MVIYDKMTINGTTFSEKIDMQITTSMSDNNTASTFTVTIPNNYGRNKNIVSPGNEIVIYAEQNVNPPTQKILGGFVSDVEYLGEYNEGKMVIYGRDYYSILQDATIPPIAYNNLDAGSIVMHAVTTNTSGLQTGSISTNTSNLISYVRYNHLHVSDAVKELGQQIDYYSYVNPDKYVMFQPIGTANANFSIGSHNTTSSRFRQTTDDMANEVYVYGDRILTAAPYIQQTSDGAGSVIQLASKPENTQVMNSGTNIVKGGIYRASSPPSSGTVYIVDYENAKVIWVSGPGLGNNIPGSLTVSRVDYDRSVPIVKYGKDDASANAYGTKSKVIINKAIKDPRMAMNTVITELGNFASPRIQGYVTVQGVSYALPGQFVNVNLPNEGVSNKNYQILEATYNFNPISRHDEKILSLKLNHKLLDVSDTIKQLIIELRKMQGGDMSETDIITRLSPSTGSFGLASSYYSTYRYIGSAFILGHSINGVLGSVPGLQPVLGISTGSTLYSSGGELW